MARHSIHYTPRGATTFYNVHRDLTGEPLLFLDENEVKSLRLDFADYLDTGETISSVASTAKSVTVSVATSSPTVTLTLSAAQSHSDGSVTLVVTFSTGAKWRGIIRVRRTDRFTDEALVDDYV
jgi:hypothetical protein